MNKRTKRNVACGLLVGTLLIHAWLFWKERSLIAKGYPDFTIFYFAGLMVRQGLGHQLYDDEAQYRIQRGFAQGIAIRREALPYNHPPFEALIFTPLTYLPYPVAYLVWDIMNLGILALIPRLLRPHIAVLRQIPQGLWVLGLLAFSPAFSVLLLGQDAILLLLLEVLAFVALKRHADTLSGCWLGLGSFKFHFVFPLMLMIWLGWKRPKVFLGFVAMCLCLGTVSVAIIGWQQALHYPEYVLHVERVMEQGAIVSNMTNLRGLLEGWTMSAGVLVSLRRATLLFSCALLLWAIAISRKHSTRQMDLHFALASTVTVLISYHAFAYDMVLLAIPLLVAIDYLARTEFRLSKDPTFFLPVVLLLLAPLYILLSLWFPHTNLLAAVLLSWLLGFHKTIKAGSIPIAAVISTRQRGNRVPTH